MQDKAKRDPYAETTARVVAALESGSVPWRKPWTDTEGPRNLVSKKAYRGINPFLLELSGFASPWWISFKQAKQLGGKVRAGEKSTMVVFWKRIKVRDQDSPDPSATRMLPLLRYYNVFNVEQCEGLDEKVPAADAPDFVPDERAEETLQGYFGADAIYPAPTLSYGGNVACYMPGFDEVRLPPREAFASTEAFYRVAFHESVHSTGHESRLARPEMRDSNGFGDDSYSREELTAEMGAAMLAGHCGLTTDESIDQSAAYLRSWINALSEDPKLLVHAAARAQRAADVIRGITWEND